MGTCLLASFASLLVPSCALPGILPSPQAANKRPFRACALYHPLPDVADIMATASASFRSYPKRHSRRDDVVKVANDSNVSRRALVSGWNCTTSAIPTPGDVDNGSNGVLVTNADAEWRAFFLYHNSCDDIPWKYIWIGPGATRFVSLPALFEGRIVRGNDEVSLCPSLPYSYTALLYGCSRAECVLLSDKIPAGSGTSAEFLAPSEPGLNLHSTARTGSGEMFRSFVAATGLC